MAYTKENLLVWGKLRIIAQELGPDFRLRLGMGIVGFYLMLFAIFIYILILTFAPGHPLHWDDLTTIYLLTFTAYGAVYALTVCAVGHRANRLLGRQTRALHLAKGTIGLQSDESRWFMPSTEEDLLNVIDDQINMLEFWKEQYPISLLGAPLNWSMFATVSAAFFAQLTLLFQALQ